MFVFRRLELLAVLVLTLLVPPPAFAHCDTTKGPVVTAANAALAAGDPNLVLHWVRPDDEAAVRSAFQHTMEVRALGPAAKELADRYFFETVVRMHRAGEGAPYTGLGENEPEPIVTTTERALDSGSVVDLEDELIKAVRSGLAQRFTAARMAKDFQPGDVAGGRAYVGAYVPLIHWVEAVFTAAKGGGDHHEAAQSHDPAAHPEALHAR